MVSEVRNELKTGWKNISSQVIEDMQELVFNLYNNIAVRLTIKRVSDFMGGKKFGIIYYFMSNVHHFRCFTN